MEGKGSGPSCSGPNLVAHPRAKSKVWKYFGFDTDADGCILHWKRIYCRICMNQIAYSGNTSNLSYHLEKNHPIEFGEFVKSNADQMREVFATVFPRTKTEPSVSHVQHLNQETTPRQSLDYETRRHGDLTAAVVTFLCEGLYPVSLVEEPAFKTLMSTVDPGYSPPCKSDLLAKMLPQMYSRTRDRVLGEVAGVLYCGITTDLWQSQMQNRTYISLYLHALNCTNTSGFSVINRCLETFEVQEENAAENITRAMYEAFVQWGITHKVSGATTNGSVDIVKACSLLELSDRSKVESDVIEEAKAILERQIAERPSLEDFASVSDEPPIKKQTPLRDASVGQENPLAAIFCQSGSNQSQEELHAQVVEELSNYKSQRVLGLNEDPLLWWSSHAHLFPTLPKVLQKYWCIPAMSVPCHRLFSSSGAALCGKRNRIAPALVHQQVFVYENSRSYYEPEL
ncbi:unnamed protein product, partial [Tetraodon nigroviridis]